MRKVISLVDGFNLYHGIEEMNKPQYKWLDLTKLIRCFIRSDETLIEIHYFSAYCHWDPVKEKRHKILVKAYENDGIHVHMGKFADKRRTCRSCGNVYQAHEEKWTDVNIGIYLLDLAYSDTYDTALVLSGDGDFLPAIEMTKQRFPAKRIGVLFPPRRSRHDLEAVADYAQKIDRKSIRNSLYPPTIPLKDGTALTCPPKWQPPISTP